MTDLAPLLQTFFTQRLVTQQNASPHTVAAYRDTFRLLLIFAQEHTGIPPARLSLKDLDAPLLSAYLDHLESQRGVSIKTVTAGWPRCTPCSASPPCATPSTPRSSSECSPFPPNALPGR